MGQYNAFITRQQVLVSRLNFQTLKATQTATCTKAQTAEKKQSNVHQVSGDCNHTLCSTFWKRKDTALLSAATTRAVPLAKESTERMQIMIQLLTVRLLYSAASNLFQHAYGGCAWGRVGNKELWLGSHCAKNSPIHQHVLTVLTSWVPVKHCCTQILLAVCF